MLNDPTIGKMIYYVNDSFMIIQATILRIERDGDGVIVNCRAIEELIQPGKFRQIRNPWNAWKIPHDLFGTVNDAYANVIENLERKISEYQALLKNFTEGLKD